ncbi:MAG: uroporphyrinogen-III C-methyltransferase [Dehalococcoidia bacterium]|nr:uroporphyrinogen-III C-methyltransferase [Dehalococcoidia bacterium]
MAGKVFLVGAGPGDPGLITVKGLESLRESDVLVYDRLLDTHLLSLSKPDSEHIFVGKERGRQALTQEQINNLLVTKALEGKTVCRLKGGDPFVFGRGGEEALVLKEHSISFEVIPGITSPIAAAAYSGIPITQRKVATCFTIVSGSEDPSKPESAIPWDILAKTGGTLAILMGWAALPNIMDKLIQNGMATDTPVALIQWGTWNKQVTVTGNLANIVEVGLKSDLKPPVIAIIGEVVNLRESLRWFDNKPLFGKKILVTRSRAQSSNLIKNLKELGADTIEIPSIEISQLDDYTHIDSLLKDLDYDWIIFSSANAVDIFFGRLTGIGKDSRDLTGITIGAIGPATTEALNRHGINPDFVPRRSVSEEVLNELSSENWRNRRVLLPSSNIGRDVLEKGLKELGAKTLRIPIYNTSRPKDVENKAKQAVQSGLDLITFTSSSTVENLLDILSNDKQYLETTPIACIGPITAKSATNLGLEVNLIASTHTVDGLVSSITEYFSLKET